MSPLHVLVVDDSADDRYALVRALKKGRHAYQVVEVSTIQEALTEIDQRVPDVILLDQHLRDGTGEGLLAELRARNHDMVAVVVITGSSGRVSVEELFALGADNYLEKQEVSTVHLDRAISNARIMATLRADAEASRRALKEQLELEERLIGVVGHDLRTPLNSIRLATEVLRRQMGESESNRYLAVIDRGCARLEGIVNRLLDLTRLRQGSGFPVTPRSNVDAFGLIAETVAELQPAERPRFSIHIEGDGRGTFDSSAICQVLSNLFNNALQYGEAKSPIEVHATATEDSVTIAVSNRSLDIEPKRLHELFAAFERGTGGGNRGLGLGLYIVRGMVTAHGGSVQGASLNGITTFTIELPKHGKRDTEPAPA